MFQNLYFYQKCQKLRPLFARLAYLFCRLHNLLLAGLQVHWRVQFMSRELEGEQRKLISLIIERTIIHFIGSWENA